MTSSPTMMVLKLRFVHQDVDRYGHVRIYFWRKGQRKARIREKLGTPEFFDAYRRLLEQSETGGLPPAVKDGGRSAVGTWRWLCTLYFTSAEFGRLDARGQRVQRRILETTFDESIRPGAKEKFGDFPLNRMQAKAIRVLRDLKNTPEGANNRLKAVRRVFNWAVDNDHVATSPAREVKLVPSGSQGFHTWTTDEVERFEARHAIGTKARLALSLLMYTGARRSDVVLLGRQHVRAGWIKFTQQKNQRRRPVTIEVPMLPVLQKVIEASPTGDLTFLSRRTASRSALPALATSFASGATRRDYRSAPRMASARPARPSRPRTAPPPGSSWRSSTG